MLLLIEVTDTYARSHENRSHEERFNEEKLQSIEGLMKNMIRQQHQAEELDCNPSQLRERLRNIAADDICTVHWNDDHGDDTQRLFVTSTQLLELSVSRRAAEIQAHKVAGHKLPVELVELICDFVCSVNDFKPSEHGPLG